MKNNHETKDNFLKKDFFLVLILTVIILGVIIGLYLYDQNKGFSVEISEKLFSVIVN